MFFYVDVSKFIFVAWDEPTAKIRSCQPHKTYFYSLMLFYVVAKSSSQIFTSIDILDIPKQPRKFILFHQCFDMFRREVKIVIAIACNINSKSIDTKGHLLSLINPWQFWRSKTISWECKERCWVCLPSPFQKIGEIDYSKFSLLVWFNVICIVEVKEGKFGWGICFHRKEYWQRIIKCKY